MKIAIIGGSGFVGSRLIGLLQTVPNIELLNIDKQQSELYPHLTQIALSLIHISEPTRH